MWRPAATGGDHRLRCTGLLATVSGSFGRWFLRSAVRWRYWWSGYRRDLAGKRLILFYQESGPTPKSVTQMEHQPRGALPHRRRDPHRYLLERVLCNPGGRQTNRILQALPDTGEGRSRSG